MLVFQAMAVASADLPQTSANGMASEQSSEPHCNGNAECPGCCPEGATMHGCTSLCTVQCAPTAIAITLLAPDTAQHVSFAARLLDDPAYLPLNPPPIS